MKKYQIIYADPPWTYKKSGGSGPTGRGLAKQHYNCLTSKELANLPIQNIANADCFCFMWVTAPKMQEGLDLMKLWGFEFNTIAFTWIKMNKKTINTLFWGMGYSTRSNAEYVLLGKKGKLERKALNIHSVLMSPVKGHSQKPAEIRNRIELLYGNLSRIELFARKKTKGWDTWGNEVSNDIEL